MIARIYKYLLFSFLFLGVHTSFAQETYKENKSLVSKKYIFQASETYEVQHFDIKSKKKKPKNIILLIGDGMGIAQIHAAMTANKGSLFLENFKHLGFQKTHSSNNYITDSAAGGTALACGKKTYNGAIGVDPDKNPVKNVREHAAEQGKATGVVSTSAITHATPASFVAHQPKRSMYEAIAADFVKSDIDVFIGGGINHFEKRKDQRNLSEELKEKGYRVLYNMNEIQKVKQGKLAALVAPGHVKKTEERGIMLETATKTALNILDNNKNGFFLMVEGSQIDWAGHQNNTEYLVKEMLDFDRTIGIALKFAAQNKNTLIIVTADHETGGMTINKGSIENQRVEAGFNVTKHTGVMVPVFAIGPSAEKFTGIIDNTEIGKKIFELLDK